VNLYTDGGCRGNPGPGGWGAILRWGQHYKELSGFVAETTNNQMELMAVIKGLEALSRPCRVEVYSDSKYLRDGMTSWLTQWKKNGWRTAAKKPVKNQELWQSIDALAQKHQVTWHWVKGHAGHAENERCDALANLAMDKGTDKGTDKA
jgi:ribonuclease HI